VAGRNENQLRHRHGRLVAVKEFVCSTICSG